MNKKQKSRIVYRMVRKTVSIPRDMDVWLRRNHVALSKFLQDKIGEEMKRKR
jgi:hypothetical protein